MNTQLLKTVGEIGGVAGLAIGALVLVFHDILKKTIFPKLRPEAASRFLHLIVLLTWSVSALGILAWVYVQVRGKNGDVNNTQTTTSGPNSPTISQLNGNVNYYNSLVGNAKQETSSDPRKELENLGITWTHDKFVQAVRDRDFRAIELFLKSGMRADWTYTSMRIPFLDMFVKSTLFDPKTADMILKYNAVDPVKACPTSTSYVGWDTLEDFDFYTTDARPYPDVAKFVRAVCHKPEIIAKINEHIKELKTKLTSYSAGGTSTRDNISTGDPARDAFRQAARENMGNYPQPPNADSLKVSIKGWEDASAFLAGSA